MRKESARLLSQLSQLSFEELGGRLKHSYKNGMSIFFIRFSYIIISLTSQMLFYLTLSFRNVFQDRHIHISFADITMPNLMDEEDIPAPATSAPPPPRPAPPPPSPMISKHQRFYSLTAVI